MSDLSHGMRDHAAELAAALPLPLRWAAIGGLVAGVVGGVVGLVIGLIGYPPTAWFAVIELGLPAAVLGSLFGLLAGAVAWAYRAVRRPHR